MSNAPNIIYIFTDEQYSNAMSCAGNTEVDTPSMDRLARAGVRFDSVYCTYPLCTPSRASMFTGKMPHEIGIDGNQQTISPMYRPDELGNILSSAGYECVYGGKWHVPEISITGGHGFKKISDFSDWELADKCIKFIKKPHDNPFFLVASFDNPHNICEWSRQQVLPWGPIKDVPTEECPNLPSNYAISAYEPEAIQAERTPRPRSIFRGSTMTDDDWRHYRHAYYRLVEKVDLEIGKILDALDEENLTEETIIIFSSDHGDGLGAHRWNQKSVLYEESTRVPLILSWKNHISANLVDSKHLISSGLDIYPTVCDYAGVDIPEGLLGQSLKPILESSPVIVDPGRPGPSWRDHLVVETKFGEEIGGLGTIGRMVRTEEYKYIVYNWGKYREQLFDLHSDPGEMTNLAIESRYNGVLNDHRDLLAMWTERTDDRHSAHESHPDSLPPVPNRGY